MNQKRLAYLPPKERRRKQHIALLLHLEELKARGEAQKRRRDETKAKTESDGNGSSDSSTNNNSTTSDAGNIITGTTSSWQVMSALNTGMEFPRVWAVSFGRLAHFFMFDLAALFAAMHAAVFIFLVCLAMFLIVGLTVVQCLSKPKKKKEIVKELCEVASLRKKALKDDVQYKPPKQGLRFKLTFALATTLSAIYMPLTNQALAVVFCHPTLLCIYDCYNDSTHNTLVVFGICSLLLVTIGAPLLFASAVHDARKQYHLFLGKFDVELQGKYWEVYVDTVGGPFVSIYGALHHKTAFFVPVQYLYQAAMASSIVGFDSESPEQLIVCLAIQLLFSLGLIFLQSFRQPLVNFMLSFSQLYVVVMFLLRCIYLLSPEKPGTGIAMVIVSAIALVFQIVVFVFVVKALIQNFLVDKKLEKERASRSVLSKDEGEEITTAEHGASAPSDDDKSIVHVESGEPQVKVDNDTLETSEEAEGAKQSSPERKGEVVDLDSESSNNSRMTGSAATSGEKVAAAQ